MKAEKPKTETLKSEADFRSAIKSIVTMQLEKERLEGSRDSKILKITTEFASEIATFGDKIQKIVEQAEQYAGEHRAELFVEKKSGETAFATFGFRAGKPSLVLLNDKWTWDKVVVAIKKSLGKLADVLIVTKEQPDKNAIKSNLEEKDLAKIGTKLETVEKFFIDPKRDPNDPRRLVAA